MKVTELFTSSQVGLLAALHARDSDERRKGIRNEESLKALAPSVAELLTLLVVAQGARTIVEFGTSHGYSTIHLAAAAKRTGGHVYTVDANPGKTTAAKANLESAGLLQQVTLATCDGAEFVAALPDGVDFVLVDYGVSGFAPAWEALRGKMTQGCFLFIDGGPAGYWQSGSVRTFVEALENDPEFVFSILPMKKDQLIAVRV